MSTQTPIAVRDYLARVRTALADLPTSEVDEILEDVRPHLTEIAKEIGDGVKIDAMIARLGSPESYAAELRAAGDYPVSTEQQIAPSTPRTGARFSLWSLIICVFGIALTGYGLGLHLDNSALAAFVLFVPVLALSSWYVWNRGINRVAELPEIRKLSSALDTGNVDTGKEDGGKDFLSYLRSLQPAWWLMSALLLVVIGILQLRRQPTAMLVLFVFVVLAVMVVWIGLKVKKDPRLLWLGLPISALAFGAAIGLVGHIAGYDYGYRGFAQSQPLNQTADGKPGLFYGQEWVENIYAFDAQGKPLSDVYLYDAQGRPLTLPRYTCESDIGIKTKTGEDNKFPHPNIEEGNYNSRGNFDSTCKQNDEIPFSAAIPRVPSPSTTPGPTTSNPVTPDASNPSVPNSTPQLPASSTPNTSGQPTG